MSANFSYYRIKNELEAYKAEKFAGVRIETVDDSLTHLKGFIDGVEGTPYEGGTFEIDIKIGPDYPYKAPTITFVTKIWHPVIDPLDGKISLHDTFNSWAALTIHGILITIRSWMSNIFDTNPIDFEVYDQAKTRRHTFDKTAEYWTAIYAGAKSLHNRDYRQKVEKLTKLSNDEDLAILQLSYNDWKLPEEE